MALFTGDWNPLGRDTYYRLVYKSSKLWLSNFANNHPLT